MHPAFNTPEIVAEIFSHLCIRRDFSISNPELTGEEKSCLLSVALTCTQFNAPALDLLWFFMSRLIPLFKVIRNFSYDKSSGSINGPLAKQDLQRFNAYAARIRVFHVAVVTENQICDLSPALLRVVYENGGIVLLPRLHHISFIESPPQEWFTFLIHPGLLELRVDLANNKYSFQTLQSLPEKCPHLRQLDVSIENSVCLAFIHQMKELQSLSIGGQFDMDDDYQVFNIECHFLSLLSSCSKLLHLHLGRYSPFACPPNNTPFSPVTLSSLVSLILFVELDSLFLMNGHILGATTLPSLQSLQLLFFYSKASFIKEKWADFCVSFSRIAPTLTTITLDATTELNLPFSPFISIISPHLMSLIISPEVFQLQQTDFTQILQAAPSLRTFKYTTPDKDKYLDSSTLVNIAGTLTTLSKLSICINMLEFPSVDHLPVLNNKLVQLTISAQSPPVDPVQAASCVQRLFPNLTSFSGSTESFRVEPQWRKTEAALRTLWRVRDDERTRLRIGAQTG